MRRGASEEIDLVEFARCFTERTEGSREQDAAWAADYATRWDEAEVAAARLLEGNIIITTRTAHSKALIVSGTGYNDNTARRSALVGVPAQRRLWRRVIGAGLLARIVVIARLHVQAADRDAQSKRKAPGLDTADSPR